MIPKTAASILSNKPAEGVTFSERYGNVSAKFRVGLVMDQIRRIFSYVKGMGSSRSLLVLHYNTHVARFFTFDEFKKVIDEMILLLKKRRELFGSNAQIVWKTMTAVSYAKPFFGTDGKFHTAYVSICCIKQIYESYLYDSLRISID